MNSEKNKKVCLTDKTCKTDIIKSINKIKKVYPGLIME